MVHHSEHVNICIRNDQTCQVLTNRLFKQTDRSLHLLLHAPSLASVSVIITDLNCFFNLHTKKRHITCISLGGHCKFSLLLIFTSYPDTRSSILLKSCGHICLNMVCNCDGLLFVKWRLIHLLKL